MSLIPMPSRGPETLCQSMMTLLQIYPKLTLLIDSAISLIEAAANYPAASAATVLTGAIRSPVRRQHDKLEQFANSLKLRMIIRAASERYLFGYEFQFRWVLTKRCGGKPGLSMASTHREPGKSILGHLGFHLRRQPESDRHGSRQPMFMDITMVQN